MEREGIKDWDIDDKSVYRNKEKDIGFEASEEYVSNNLDTTNVRVENGYKYGANDEDSSIYNPEEALKCVKEDAKNFLDNKAKKLAQAAELKSDSNVSIIATYDALDFGNNWYEGIDWLDEVFRQAALRDDIEITTASSLVDNQFVLQKISPFPSAMSGTGYGED